MSDSPENEKLHSADRVRIEMNPESEEAGALGSFGFDSSAGDCPSDPRVEAARILVDEFVQRRAAGESISDEDLIQQNLDLREFVEALLLQRRKFDQALERAANQLPLRNNELAFGKPVDSALIETNVVTGNSSPTSIHGKMGVRCPYCNSQIQVSSESKLNEVDCPSCGESFCLVEDTLDGPESVSESSPAMRVILHFDLLSPLGTGAFGTVWRAHDRELDRYVAIKLPRQELLGPTEQEMFLREARAAAQLNHPGIVAVHEVGRDGKQLYIVSDLVSGTSLDQWVKQQRQTPREAVELCIQIIRAIAAAHSAGVIHRDLKPSNILVSLDENKNPVCHITDFGLARRETGEATMTVEGRILGTPAFMSPEQALGKSHEADARSDIYSVGVILFQMLTGELPFRGDLRMMMFQVINDDPPAPRQLNHRIPRDVETICLKCLEKSPAARYWSAEELADDLKRFLEHRPIVARPVGPLGKIQRWCRRRPAVASAITVVVLTVIVAFQQITSAWRSEQVQRESAEHNRDDALEGLQMARGAVDLWLTGISDILKWYPALQEPRERMLQAAAEDYAAFVAMDVDDPKLRLEQGRTLLRLSDVQKLQLNLKAAETSSRSAVAFFGSLVDDPLTRIAARRNLASSHLRLALITFELQSLDRVDKELVAVDSALNVSESWLKSVKREIPSSETGQDGWQNEEKLTSPIRIQWYLLKSQLEESRGDFLKAEKFRREAVVASGKLLKKWPNDKAAEQNAARVQQELASLLTRLGKPHAAAAEFRKAISVFETLTALEPDEPLLLNQRGNCLLNAVDAFRSAGFFSDQRRASQLAVEDFEDLTTALPGVTDFEESLAFARSTYAQLLHGIDNNRDALKLADESVEALEALHEKWPRLARYRSSLAWSLNVRGRIAGVLGDYEVAVQSLNHSAIQYSELEEAAPDNLAWSELRAISVGHLGRVLGESGEVEEGDKYLTLAIDSLTELAAASPEIPAFQSDLAWMLFHRGSLRHKADVSGENSTTSDFSQCRQIWKQLTQQFTSMDIRIGYAELLLLCPDSGFRDANLARTALNEAIDQVAQSASARAWQLLALAAARVGEKEDGLKALDNVRSLTDTESASDLFIKCLLIAGQDADVARVLFENGCEVFSANTPSQRRSALLKAEAANSLDL